MEKSWIIAVVTIGAVVTVNSLQCYTCINCPASELKDSDLVTCAAPPDPGTNGTEPEINGTIPGTNGTESGNGSTNPGTNGTETGNGGTNPGTNGTESGNSSIDPGINGTETENGGTNPGVNGTETENGGTNQDSGDADSAQLQVLRVRRNIQSTSKALLYADETFVCAQATVKGPNDTDIIIRGCAEPTICSSPENVNATDCKTCTQDKCNDAYKMEHSMLPLLFVLTSLIVTN